MSIGVALVSEPRLDLSVFTKLAERITGENPVREVDARPGRSPIDDMVRILNNFTELGHVTESVCLGFLVAGPLYQMNEFLHLTAGMPFIQAKNVQPDARAVIVTGSLQQWVDKIVWACSTRHDETVDPRVRKAFNEIQGIMIQRGFNYLFTGYSSFDNNDGTHVLRLK